MIRSITLTLALSTAITFQAFSQSFSSQTGGHCFTLDIPEYMTKTYQLNDVASLQYMNAAKEAYVMVIEDAKDHLEEVGTKFIDSEDFLNNFTQNYQVESPNRNVGEVKNFKSNGFGHSQVEMSWGSDESSIYMLVTTVETPEHFYKIMCWTLLPYEDKFKNDYLKISKSLKE